MNRQEVAQLVLSASTLPECDLAEQALSRWIEQHPDDVGMQDIGEGLAMMREALSPDAGDDASLNGMEHTEHLPARTSSDGRERTYRLSFEEEVRLAQEELGWDLERARAFVASYRPAPDDAPAAGHPGDACPPLQDRQEKGSREPSGQRPDPPALDPSLLAGLDRPG